MKYGHVTGTRRQRPTASEWYDAIEAATLARLDATWPTTLTLIPQEVPHDITPNLTSIVSNAALPVHTFLPARQ